MHSSTVSAMETSRCLGSTVSQDLKWSPNRDTIIRKGLAEHPLPLPAQEVQPVLEAVETFVLCNNTVSSLLIHHCMVWISHQTGQGQTIEDSEDSRKKKSLLPNLFSTNQESRNEQTSALQTITPWSQPVPAAPSDTCSRSKHAVYTVYCFVLVYI